MWTQLSDGRRDAEKLPPTRRGWWQRFCPMRDELCGAPSNQSGPNAGGLGLPGLAPQNQRIWSPLRSSVSGGVYIPSLLCGERGGLTALFFFLLRSFSLTVTRCRGVHILCERWRRQPPIKEWNRALKAVPGNKCEEKTAEKKNLCAEEQKKRDADEPRS